MNQNNELKEKKPKTWDEAILELKGFILNAKKEELEKQAENNQNETSDEE